MQNAIKHFYALALVIKYDDNMPQLCFLQTRLVVNKTIEIAHRTILFNFNTCYYKHEQEKDQKFINIDNRVEYLIFLHVKYQI